MEKRKEFLKLNPQYKVPDIEHFDYYASVLSKIYPTFNVDLDNFNKSWNLYLLSGKKSYKSYKLDLVDNLILDLKNDYLEHINSKNIIEHGLSTLESSYLEGRYLSIDLVQANHFSFWDLADKKTNLKFEETPLFIEKLNNDPALLNSKSLRQLIYGNLNPKRQINYSKSVIKKIIDVLRELPKGIEVFKINSDELVLKFNSDFKGQEVENFEIILNKLHSRLEGVQFKISRFKVELFNLHGDTVKLKTNLINNEKKIIESLGNRFYLYVPLLLPNHIIDDRDFLVKIDGMKAKWIV